MITIKIYRHGETAWNKKGLIQGHSDIPLNLNGLGQALVLADKLQNDKIDLVLSSDLSRAHQTARVVMKKQNDLIPLILSPKLREMSFGDAEGKTYDYFLTNFSDQLSIIDDPHHELTFDTSLPNGETHRAVLNRFLQCLEDNINRYPNSRNIAIFAHGGLMRIIVKYLVKEIRDFNNTEPLVLYYDLDKAKLSLSK
jgi:broad specificity phosphatase PhoE